MLCKSCHTEKEVSAFYLSNASRCKECIKTSVREHRQANLEKFRSYDRMRGSMPHRVQARAEYQKTDAFAESHARSVSKWQRNNPSRRAAQNALNNAVRYGLVAPWPVCALPECSDQPEAHHPDYSQPLSVVWLCPAHHHQAHAITRNYQEIP